MKKTSSFRIAFLLLLFVSILGCNSAKGQIQRTIDVLNSQMPISLGLMGDMTSVSISNGYLNMVVYVNEDIVNIDALNKSPELVHNNLVQMYTNNTDSGIGALLKELKDAGLGHRITYIGKKSGKSVSASLSNAEIRKIAATPASAKNPVEILKAQIRATNAQLPMDIGNGMIMYKMALEGGYVVWYYKWDDENVKLLDENRDEIKRQTLNQIKNSDDLSMEMMKQMCKDAGYGMAYCYVAQKSGKQVRINIKAYEF